jgi:hypothetical protein
MLTVPSAVEACTCLEAGPACEAFWKSSAVFRGRVDSIVRQASKPPSRIPGARRVTLTVLEAYSGVQTQTVEVTTGSGGGDCGFPFREGAEYVVYAQRGDRSGPLTVSLCSRTRELAQARDDLDYGRAIRSNAPMQARVAGDVVLESRSLTPARAPGGSTPAPGGPPRPLTNVGVRLERNGQVTRAVTSADGRFSITELPPGRYTATLELPDGVYANGWPKTIDLADARACVELHVTAFADGRVSGVVVDASGRPVVGLTVELTAPVGIDDPLGPERLRDLTDEGGRYEIVHVPAGRFVVGINTQRPREGGATEPRLFHPGVATPAGSTRVMLKAGERVELPPFTLPRDVVYITITGLVVDASGVPAAGARVYLKGQSDADYILSEPAVTDGSGRFALAAVAGRSYRLFAERPRGEGTSRRLDSSEHVPVAATPGLAPLRVVLRRVY